MCLSCCERESSESSRPCHATCLIDRGVWMAPPAMVCRVRERVACACPPRAWGGALELARFGVSMNEYRMTMSMSGVDLLPCTVCSLSSDSE